MVPSMGRGPPRRSPPGIPELAGAEVRVALPAPELAPSRVAKQHMQLVN